MPVDTNKSTVMHKRHQWYMQKHIVTQVATLRLKWACSNGFGRVAEALSRSRAAAESNCWTLP